MIPRVSSIVGFPEEKGKACVRPAAEGDAGSSGIGAGGAMNESSDAAEEAAPPSALVDMAARSTGEERERESEGFGGSVGFSGEVSLIHDRRTLEVRKKEGFYSGRGFLAVVLRFFNFLPPLLVKMFGVGF